MNSLLLVAISFTVFSLLLLSTSSNNNVVEAAGATVSYLQCRNCLATGKPTPGSPTPSCAASTFAENTCAMSPFQQTNGGNGYYYFNVQCDLPSSPTAPATMCAQFQFSLEPQLCSTFYSVSNMKCGGCNTWDGSSYWKLECSNDLSKDLIVQWWQCSDNQCSQNCKPRSTNTGASQPTQYTLDQCAPIYVNEKKQQVYGKLLTISPCQTATVKLYNSSSSCSSGTAQSLVAQQQLGQSRCDTWGRFSCSNAPNVTASSGPTVLTSDFADHGKCLGEVYYSTSKSGSCRFLTARESVITTCLGQNGYCADLLMFYNGQSQSRYAPACGTCQKFPGDTTWTRMDCNVSANQFKLQYGCSDNTCSKCLIGNATVFPYDHNVLPGAQYPGWSIMSMGVIPCTLVKRQVYNDSSCGMNGGKNIDTLFVAENICSWGHIATCGANFQEQQLVLGQCLSQKPQDISGASGTCYNISNKWVPNAWMIARCAASDSAASPRTCAYLHFWSNYSIIQQRGYVCGSCYFDKRSSNYTVGPFRIDCPDAATMTMTPCNDNTCDFCDNTKIQTLNLFNFTHFPSSLGKNLNADLPVMLGGVARCSAAFDASQYTYDASAQQQCTTSSSKTWHAQLAQDSCDAVCTDPPRESANYEKNYDVISKFCMFPGLFHGGKHHQASQHYTKPVCFQHRHPSRQCVPLDAERAHGIWTLNATCGIRGNCANLRFYNSSDSYNCQVFKPGTEHFTWNPVCDSCQHTHHWGWTYVFCDYASYNVTLLRNCSSHCDPSAGSLSTQCKMAPLVISNKAGCNTQVGGGFAGRNLGVSPCDVVKVQIYNSSDCSGSSLHTIVAQEGGGTMRHGHISHFTCLPKSTNYVLPGGVASYFPCNKTSKKPLVPNIPQATCMPELRAPGTSSMINCHAARMDSCATFSFFTSSSCLQGWKAIESVPCNSCFRVPGATNEAQAYAWIKCNGTNTGGSMLSLGCNKGCTQCNPSYAALTSEILGQCAPLQISSSSYWAQFVSVRPCATAQYMEWSSNKQCQGSPDKITYVQQGMCQSGIGSITCQFQPQLPPKPVGNGVNVRLQMCSSPGCSGICSVHTEPSGACVRLAISVAGGTSAKLTCTGQVNTCAHMMYFRNSRWMGKSAAVCGTCTEWHDGTFGMFKCFSGNQSIVRAHGCNSDCSVCTSNITIAGAYQMTNIGHGYSLLNLGLYSCNTVRRQVYNDSACKQKVIIDGPVPEDTCSNGVQLSCGKWPVGTETVTRTNCSNPSQPANLFENSQCTVDPRYKLSPAQSGGGGHDTSIKTRYDCLHGMAPCANFAAVTSNSTSCDIEKVFTVRCNSCLTSGGKYLWLACNATEQSATMTLCKDVNCKQCDSSKRQKYPAGQCVTPTAASQIPIVGTYFGMTSCSLVKESFYWGIGNMTCSPLSLKAQVTYGSGYCNGDIKHQCGSYMDVPSGPIPVGGDTNVNFLQCADEGCSKQCSSVAQLATSDCVAPPNFGKAARYSAKQPPYTVASQFSCPISGTCARFNLFNRTHGAGYTPGTCTKVPQYSGHNFVAVCNSCHWTHWGGMVRVDCSLITELAVVHLHCDGNCQNCGYSFKNALMRGYDNCTQMTTLHGQSFDIVNTGTYPCAVVTAKGFLDQNCRTLNHTVAFPQSTCQFGSIVTCPLVNKYPTPPTSSTPSPTGTIAPTAGPPTSSTPSPTGTIAPTAGTTTTPSPNSNNNAGNNTGGGGGSSGNGGAIAAGIIVPLVVIGAGVWFFFFRKKSSEVGQQYHDAEGMNQQYAAFMETEDPMRAGFKSNGDIQHQQPVAPPATGDV